MPVSRSYSLYSDVQRAYDIIVTIPAKVGEKHFKPEQRVNLSIRRLLLMVKMSKSVVFINYILTADDMILKNKSGQADNSQNHAPQGQPIKRIHPLFIVADM